MVLVVVLSVLSVPVPSVCDSDGVNDWSWCACVSDGGVGSWLGWLGCCCCSGACGEEETLALLIRRLALAARTLKLRERDEGPGLWRSSGGT